MGNSFKYREMEIQEKILKYEELSCNDLMVGDAISCWVGTICVCNLLRFEQILMILRGIRSYRFYN